MSLTSVAGGSARAHRPARRAPRLASIDVLRGLAVCGMVAFHVAWDLHDWGWSDISPARSVPWMILGNTVASTFLFVSGVCLWLARRRGMRSALRRLAVLLGTAGLVTAATRWVAPDAYVFFGILHCIALSNLIALVFLHRPPWLGAIAAAAAALAPWAGASINLEGPLGWGLGLARSVPPTLDYRPVLPWLAAVLAGVAAAPLSTRLNVARGPHRVLSPFAWVGRHSLAIYLAHQPILFALVFVVFGVQGAGGRARSVGFEPECRRACVGAGAGQAGCAAGCTCMAERLASSSRPIDLPGAITPSDLDAAGAACLGATMNNERPPR